MNILCPRIVCYRLFDILTPPILDILVLMMRRLPIQRLLLLSAERSEVRTLSKDIAGSPSILMAILWAGMTL